MPKFSVKKPMTIFVIVILVCLLGFISVTSMTTDLLPKMDLPYVAVFTTYPGASPEKIEQAVTKPLEQTLSTTSGVKNVTSISNENTSVVILEFTQDTNMDSVMIEMSGSIDMVKASLDDAVGTPTLIKINPDLMPVMVASVDMDGGEIGETSQLVQDTVLPAFERIDGVASVTATGIVEDSIEVTLSQTKIDELNRRVLASVDEQLAEAQEKLDAAKEEITDGKQQISEMGKTQAAKLVDAGLQLSAGRDQIEAAISSLPAMQQELQAQLTDLQAQKTALETQLADAKTARDSLQQTIAGLVAAGQPVPEELTTQLATLEQSIPQMEAGLTQLTDGITQIEAGIAQIPVQKEQLEQKLAELGESEKQLETGKITLSTELAQASGQLAGGEAQLQQSEEEFEKQKDAAYQQAGLDDKITQDTISQILAAQNFSMPAGYIKDGTEKYLVKVGDQIGDMGELEHLVLFDISAGDIGKVTLSDVADIKMTDNRDELYAKINGNDGILLSFQKQSTSSTTDVSSKINEAIKKLETDHPGMHIVALSDQGVYINIVLDSVLNNLLLGAVLAIIILFLFLKDIKPTIIVAISIPFSLLAAITLMYFCGVTLNVISLAGLALGVGMLVDNSIVVIENIYRLRSMGVSAARAAVKGATQVAGAIFASTLTTVCVFLPIVFTQGLTRQLFADMGLTIAFSLLSSLVIALTLVPAMGSTMLRKVKEKKHQGFDKFTAAYQKTLRAGLKHKWVIFVIAIGLFAFSAVSILGMGTSLIPKMDSTEMMITMEMPAGSSTQETRDMSDVILERLTALPDVETIGAMEGGVTSLMGGSASGSNNTSIMMYAILKDEKQHTSAQVAEMMREEVKDLPCTVEVNDSTMDLSMLSGSGLEVAVRGDDLDTLKQIAQEVADRMAQTEGLTNIDNGMKDASDETRISVDKNKAAVYGLTVAQVYQQISAELASGKTATTLALQAGDYPVVVQNSPENSASLAGLPDFAITGTKDGEETEVKLSEIAEISTEKGLSAINHDGQVRTLTVTADVDANHNIGLVSRDFSQKLQDYQVPDGYTVEIQGENQTITDTFTNLIYMFLLAVVLIYLIMVAQFQSLKSPFIILFTIPLAFTGGLLALLLTGSDLSMIALLGFLLLAGIVVNNGIVFVDYVNQLRLSGVERREALIRTGGARIRPILMTAFTTILGLVPLALGMGQGAEMLQPMAIVTIGGLVYATFMTLFFVPALYDVMNKKEMKQVMIEDEEEDSIDAI
ncbi:MAG: efflux RND transporter permease subunit [Christensenella sp.]|nr:efflux RND transporter permease subunit [Christensenella sp.]